MKVRGFEKENLLPETSTFPFFIARRISWFGFQIETRKIRRKIRKSGVIRKFSA